MKWLILLAVLVLVVLLGCQSADTETVVEPEPTQPPLAEEPQPTPIPPTGTAPPPTETVPPPTEEPQSADYSELEAALQGVVDAQVEAGFPGAVLLVDAPDLGFSWKGAAGMADVEDQIPMEPETPFRVSGITGTMMSALVLKMAEEGMIDLDDPISQYLDAAVIEQLNGPDGEPYGEAITIRQLLNQTSGVASYFFRDEEDKDRNNSPDFFEIIVDDPDIVWQPEDVIAHTTSNLSPNSAPGETFAATDMEDVLVRLVIEAASGTNLDEAYQTWLFGPLGMADSFVVQSGDPRMDDVAHVYYVGAVDVSDNASLSWFSDEVVSTAADLGLFMRAWADDEIFTDPASKDAMVDWISMADDGYEGLYHGLGILNFDFGQTEMPQIGEVLFQTSVWNGYIQYLPQHNVVLVGTLNQVVPFSSYNELAFPAIMTILPYVTEE